MKFSELRSGFRFKVTDPEIAKMLAESIGAVELVKLADTYYWMAVHGATGAGNGIHGINAIALNMGLPVRLTESTEIEALDSETKH